MSWEEELRRIRLKKLRELEERLRGGRRETGKVLELDSDGLRNLLKSSNAPVLVDFWAPWCMPCLMVKPVFKELAKEYAGRILFGKLNVDKNPRVPAEYGIMGIPTLLVFKEGSLVDRIVGAMSKKLLEQRLIKHL